MRKLLRFKQTAFCFLLLALSSNIVAQNFTWKKGTNLTDAVGVYGTQGVAAAGNRPGARDHAATWTDGAGNFWLFGGNGYNDIGSYGYLNDLWKYSPATNMWTWISGGTSVNQVGIYGSFGVFSPGNIPGTRFGSASFIDANDNLYLFGGYGYDIAGSFAELNDMWVYSIALNQWKWVKGATTAFQTATYGTQGVSNISNVPGARYNTKGWKDNSGNFWIYGGLGYNASSNAYLGDLWKYNPANNEWVWMKGSASLNQTGIYGTQGTAAPANAPGARCASAGWTDASGNLWLIAGYGFASTGFADLLNDMWKYNIATNEWTWIKGFNTTSVQQGTYGSLGVFAPANLPGARYDAITWRDGNGDLWMSGGYGFGTGLTPDFLNDLWRYNITNNQWKWVKGATTIAQPGNYGTIGVNSPLNMPGGRGGGATWKDNSNNLWLFGGNGYNVPNNVGRLNDLWKFDNCINPTIAISASSPTMCVGKTVTLTATGANSYTWAGSQAIGVTFTVSPPQAGTITYTAYGADINDCKDTAAISITAFSVPSLTATAANTVICAFEFTSLSAAGAVTYTWSNSQTGQNISVGPLSPTFYTVVGSDANGCQNFAVTSVSVSACTGIDAQAGLPSDLISIYPNPGNGEFTVKTEISGQKTIVIFNAVGQKVFEQTLVTGQALINTGLPRGVYYYKVQNSSLQSTTGKLMIE
jgi:N-acetylneuraminic acid mutarotase